MVDLYDFQYLVKMGFGHDNWLPFGKVGGHPRFADGTSVYTSSPVEFNLDTLVFKTMSGTEYQIVSFAGDRKKQLDYLQESVRRHQENELKD